MAKTRQYKERNPIATDMYERPNRSNKAHSNKPRKQRTRRDEVYAAIEQELEDADLWEEYDY